MASVEWSKSAVGVWGLNADFENTLKIVLRCGKDKVDIRKRTGSRGANWPGMKAAILQDPGVAHACERTGSTQSGNLCSPGPERGCAAAYSLK